MTAYEPAERERETERIDVRGWDQSFVTESDLDPGLAGEYSWSKARYLPASGKPYSTKPVPSRLAATESRQHDRGRKSSEKWRELPSSRLMPTVQEAGEIEHEGEHRSSEGKSQEMRKLPAAYEQRSQSTTTETRPSEADLSSTSYVGDIITVYLELFAHEYRSATLGGQILVKDQLWDLTVGHIFHVIAQA